MNLPRNFEISCSISYLALRLTFGAITIGSIGASSALAGEVIFNNDTAATVLQEQPFDRYSVGYYDSLYVGTVTNPSASNNIVTVDYTDKNNTQPDIYSIYGGISNNGISQNNIVYIKNGTVLGNAIGGQTSILNSSPNRTDTLVSNNFVIVTGGETMHLYGGSNQQVDYTDNTTNSVTTGNGITFSNAKNIGQMFGGWNSYYGSGDVLVNENFVEINSGSAGRIIYGAYSRYYGTGNSVVRDNKVTINGGSVSEDVYGGFFYDLDPDNYVESSVISNNTVEVNGGTVGKSIYGGYGFIKLADMNVKIINNTVTLNGSDILIGTTDSSGVTEYGSIWGGRLRYSENGSTLIDITDFDKVVSGNTLNLVRYRGTVAGIYNFENYNWTLPSDVVNGDILVTIADGGTAVDLTNTKHTIANMQAGDNRLKTGDQVTFITKTQGAFAPTNYTITQGQFIVYDATLSQKENGSDTALVLTIVDNEELPNTPGTGENGNTGGENGNSDTGNGNTGGGNGNTGGGNSNSSGHSAAKVNPQSKAYSEGRAAALGFLNQSNDLIANAGIDKIRTMVRANENKLDRPTLIPFLIMNGSYQSYKTGSHVDIKGFNMAAGLASGLEFSSGHKATIGAFFEYGHGTYDTYNSFTNFNSIHGDGNSTYKGGGVFGRIDFAGTGLGRVNQLATDQADGLYAEISLKAGRISNDFDIGRYANINNNASAYRGSYDSEVSYYGGHVAGGYVLNFDDKQSLDVYTRYLWTHMDGDTVTIANEKLRFSSSTSSRLQIGGRYVYAYNEQFKPYIGAAYEYEFKGDIKAKAYEFNLDRPSLKGGTGIFDIGFNFQPIATNSMFSINMNAQAYAGERQGGGGGVKLKYQF